MGYALCFDVGGTKIEAAIVSKKGEIIWRKKILTPETRKGFVESIALIAMQTKKIKKILAIGLGMPCFLDAENKKTMLCVHIPALNRFGLVKAIEKKTGLKTFMANDADLFALGEWAFSFNRKPKNFVGVIVGTGIGAGLILNKTLVTGNGGAGEFGHTTIDYKGFTCSCGKKGHINSMANASAILRYAKQLGLKVKDSKEVSLLAKKKDKKAVRAIQKAAFFLGVGFANLVNTLDPDVIVLGGGTSKATNLKKEAEKTMKKFWTGKHKTKIYLSKTKENAALLGAAELVFTKTM